MRNSDRLLAPSPTPAPRRIPSGRALAAATVLAVTTAVLAPPASAAPEPDPTYGDAGSVVVTGRSGQVLRPVLDPAGGVLVQQPGPRGADTLQRVTPTGQVVAAYGDAGALRLPSLPDGLRGARDLVPTADGGFWRVSAGPRGRGGQRTTLRLERITDAGRADPRVGPGGRAVYVLDLPILPGEAIDAVADALGRVVVAVPVAGRVGGRFRPQVLLRIGGDGALDEGFGARGISIVPARRGPGLEQRLVLRPGGGILALEQDLRERRLVVRALRADGRVDRTYGGDGRRVTSGQGRLQLAGAMVDDTDRLLLPSARGAGPCGPGRIGIVRWRSDGARDVAFTEEAAPVTCDDGLATGTDPGADPGAGPGDGSRTVVVPRLAAAGPYVTLTLDATRRSADGTAVGPAADRLVGLLDTGARWEGLGPHGIAVLPATRTVVGALFRADGTSDLAVITAEYPAGVFTAPTLTLRRDVASSLPVPPAPAA
ncbi:hypothetical protein [Nocardioides sp.]|uniref:hypothetical protein n=1 Tax=Nocardioides sp. TaxID=35761 RepID=UPI0035147590